MFPVRLDSGPVLHKKAFGGLDDKLWSLLHLHTDRIDPIDWMGRRNDPNLDLPSVRWS